MNDSNIRKFKEKLINTSNKEKEQKIEQFLKNIEILKKESWFMSIVDHNELFE